MKYIFERNGKEMDLTMLDENDPNICEKIVLPEEYRDVISLFINEIIFEEIKSRNFLRMASMEIEEITR